MKSLSLRLYQNWMKENTALTQKVMHQKNCEIDPEFMGFVDVYYHLSKIIPKHLTVIDIGCCYAPQCLYFKNHHKYIGVGRLFLKKNDQKVCQFFYCGKGKDSW